MKSEGQEDGSTWDSGHGEPLANFARPQSGKQGEQSERVEGSTWKYCCVELVGETFKRKKRQNSKYGLHYFKNQQKCMEDADAM